MEEQLISFDTAKLAKEKGFNIPTKTAYIGNKFFESEETPNGYDGYDPSFTENWNKKGWVTNREGGMCFGCKLDNIKYFESYTVISQSLLQKWFREKHKIFVNPIPNFKNNVGEHHLGIVFINKEEKVDTIILKNDDKLNKIFSNYEEALEEGLYQALKLIENK